MIGSDGSGLTQLTSGSVDNVYPSFSPDGTKIVFTSKRTGTSQVYVMNADGSDQTQLTFDAQPKDQVPDWSPDGSKIAYLADTHGIADIVNPSWGDIWVMNADGSGQHPITSGASWYGTAWSPDGTRDRHHGHAHPHRLHGQRRRRQRRAGGPPRRPPVRPRLAAARDRRRRRRLVDAIVSALT